MTVADPLASAKRADPLSWLRALSWLSVGVPLFLYAVFGFYEISEFRAEADKRVSRSLRVAHEHATRVVANTEALQDRVKDAVDGQSLTQLRQTQPALHKFLLDATKDQTYIQSVWIIGADGLAVASSRFSQVPTVSFADRPYLKHHAHGHLGRYLSQPFTSRTTGERVVDLSLRFDDANGNFAGVVNVSLLASYFQQFYADLVADEPGLAVNLFREDGAIYSRWPVVAKAPERLGASSPTLALIKAGKSSGQTRGISTVDGQDRLIAFRQVSAYPLYVGTGMNLTALRLQVLKDLAVLLLLGLPSFAALWFTARIAIRKSVDALKAADQLERETLTRRKAEEALVQAQKLEALGRLTGGVAHDFNNALMVISNSAYLLKRHVRSDGVRQLESIDRAVSSATKLTRQLLAFSRRQALVPEVVRLQDKFPAIRDLIAPVIGTQVELEVRAEDGTRPVRVDSAELELALLNLAINARDAMPGGGKFSLVARNAAAPDLREMTGDWVVVQARDNGQGIPADVLDRVFEPFFTTKPAGQGTGLGLSQIYGLCQRAGGSARIDSEAGAGTVVSLFFPAMTSDSVAHSEMNTRVRRDLSLHVLVVEDNAEVASGLIELLEALGCRTTRLEAAAAAKEWLDNRVDKPDVVLSDVVMPGEMDGLALARLVRSAHPEVAMILMTGYAQQIDHIRAQGFNVLPKPCSPEMLSAALSKVTASRKAS